MTRFAIATTLAVMAAAAVHGAVVPVPEHHMQARQEQIGHDQVQPFAEDVPDLYKKYKPWLKVVDGCVPFPAVNKEGQTSGGLDDTGALNGGCSKSEGQVYTQAGFVKDKFALMFAWYFPKDMNVDGPGSVGHRHDWEEIVVFLSAKDDNAKLLGISYSGHGDYPQKVSKAMLDRNGWLDGSRPKVQYSRPELLTHRVSATGTKGGDQPLINYAQLTQAARDGLANTNWKSASCPFCTTEKFTEKIEEVWDDAYN